GRGGHLRYYNAMSLFRNALTERILVLDGAMGTMIQAAGLGAEDFGGAPYEGCNEYLNLTRPDVIRGVHAAYLDAGADVISTNTFGCAPYVLGEYGLAERAHEITLAAARLARAADGQRDDRAEGHDAGGPGGRGALCGARAPGPLLDRPQLRDRARVHDRPPPLAVRDVDALRERLPQRRSARRARPVRGDAREPGLQEIGRASCRERG